MCFYLHPRSIVDRDSEKKGKVGHSNQTWVKTEVVADQNVARTFEHSNQAWEKAGEPSQIRLSWEPKMVHDSPPIAFPRRCWSTGLVIYSQRREAIAEIKTRWKTKLCQRMSEYLTLNAQDRGRDMNEEVNYDKNDETAAFSHSANLKLLPFLLIHRCIYQ